MKWILIVWSFQVGAVPVDRYDSEAACVAVGESYKAQVTKQTNLSSPKYVCLEAAR